jgi:hypothetical protein
MASDIFRVVRSLIEVVGVRESMGREIERDDERATFISDGNPDVMCTIAS